MQATLSELTALRDAWRRLIAARPGEKDFSSFGYAGLNADAIDGAIGNLVDVVDAHVRKTKAAEKSEMSLADGAVVRVLREARTWVDSAQSNGLSWLITSTDFLPRLGSANSLLRQAIGRNVDLNARIARLVADEIHNDVTVVQQAAGAAKDVLDRAKDVAASQEVVNSAKAQAEAVRGEASTTLEEARTIADQLTKAKNEVLQASEEIRVAKSVVDTAKNNAEKDASALQGSVAKLNESIEAALKRAAEAVSQLDAGLRDARRQGLAAAFSERHSAARFEYYLWISAFLIAIAGLAVLGWFQFAAFQDEVVATAIKATVDGKGAWVDGLLLAARRVLGELPLAIPVVWLGWYSAKRIGAVSRLMQDYEYKAATALAFESYKNETLLLGGGELSEQLLLTTINNFGQNPARFAEANKDHAHPLEALLDTIKDEKSYDRFLKLIDKLRRVPG